MRPLAQHRHAHAVDHVNHGAELLRHQCALESDDHPHQETDQADDGYGIGAGLGSNGQDLARPQAARLAQAASKRRGAAANKGGAGGELIELQADRAAKAGDCAQRRWGRGRGEQARVEALDQLRQARRQRLDADLGAGGSGRVFERVQQGKAGFVGVFESCGVDRDRRGRLFAQRSHGGPPGGRGGLGRQP